MPEAGRHAPILIATSWQAMNRARAGHPHSEICDSTITILFAGFFIEANLNHIVRVLRRRNRLQTFVGPRRRYPGLGEKMAWFYNDYVEPTPATNLQAAGSKRLHRRVNRRFRGFAKLQGFRNDISHGVINRSGRSLPDAIALRQRAKDIVDELFTILRGRGHQVRRGTSYWKAISK